MKIFIMLRAQGFCGEDYIMMIASRLVFYNIRLKYFISSYNK